MADLSITQAGQQYQDKLSSVGVPAVISQCVLMICISLVAFLAFNFLRPRNDVVYAPKQLHDADRKAHVRPPSDGFFAWLPVEKLGLDAAVFLRFLRLLRTLHGIVALASVGLLLPLNVLYNRRYVASDQRNELSQLTVANVQGRWLWGSIAAGYLFNLVAMSLVWWHTREVTGRRMEYFVGSSFTNSLHTRCLLVTHIPEDIETDDQLRAIMSELDLPHPPVRVSLGHELGDLPDLLDDQHDAVKKLESALLSYLKRDKLGAKRPTTRPGPWWKLWVPKVDAIDYQTERIASIEQAIADARKQFGRPESHGYVSFSTAAQAHACASKIKGQRVTSRDVKILHAPEPRDIIWSNVSLSRGQLKGMRIAFGFLLAAVLFWYTIPLALVSVVANLATLSEYLTFLKKWQAANNWSFSLVSGIIAPVLAGIFAVLLPIALRVTSKYQGAYSFASLELVVLKRLYTLFIISQLFVFSILSVVLQLIANVFESVEAIDSGPIINSLKELPSAISSAYLAQANFWLTWLPMRGFLAFYDLANLIKLLLVSSTYLFNQTPRAVRERAAPPKFLYAQQYANLLLISAVGLIYAPLAPLVAAFATFALTISSATFKYQLAYVFSSEIDTGGDAWPVVIDRLLVNVALMDTFLILTVSLQNREVGPSCVAAGPLLALALFRLIVIRWQMRRFNRFPTTDAEASSPQLASDQGDSGDEGNSDSRRHGSLRRKLAKLARPLDGVLAAIDGGGGDGSNDGEPDNRPAAASELQRRLRTLAPKHDLDRQFGHPALTAPLWTPMIFARHERLLTQVYEGRPIRRIEVQVSELDNQHRRADQVGGVTIVPVKEAELVADEEVVEGRPEAAERPDVKPSASRR